MLCLIVIVIVWLRVMFVCAHDVISSLSKLLFTHKSGKGVSLKKTQIVVVHYCNLDDDQNIFGP